MSFKDYYQEKKNGHSQLRDEICELLEISLKTFYNRLADDSWTRLERQAISAHLGISVDILFPETTAAI